MTTPKTTGYLQSLANELVAQADRVRDLIGDAHWLHEGRHKEHLLLEMISRHLPATITASTGFVISPNQSICSREQDILIVSRATEAPVFAQGGLVVAFPKNVVAAISVKTAFDASTVKDSAMSLFSVRHVAAASGADPARIWCGAFFFREPETADDALPFRWYRNLLASFDWSVTWNGQKRQCVPADVMASSAKHVLLSNDDPLDATVSTLRSFRCPDPLATAIFVSHLIDHMAVRLGASRADYMDFADVAEVSLLRTERVPFKNSPETQSDQQTKT